MKKGLKIGLIVGGVVVAAGVTFFIVKKMKSKNDVTTETFETDMPDSETMVGGTESSTNGGKPAFNSTEATTQITKNGIDSSKQALYLDWMQNNHNSSVYENLKTEAEAKGVPYYQKLFFYTGWLLKEKGLV